MTVNAIDPADPIHLTFLPWYQGVGTFFPAYRSTPFFFTRPQGRDRKSCDRPRTPRHPPCPRAGGARLARPLLTPHLGCFFVTPVTSWTHPHFSDPPAPPPLLPWGRRSLPCEPPADSPPVVFFCDTCHIIDPPTFLTPG